MNEGDGVKGGMGNERMVKGKEDEGKGDEGGVKGEGGGG